MPVNRTQDEIAARAQMVSKEDLLGFRMSVLVPYLDFDHAKQFLKADVTREEWESVSPPADPREDMASYMQFAWDKANNKRGISANRSICKYIEWLWLDGDDTLSHAIELEYEYYGKPQLRQICEYLGLDADQWDDGIRENS